MYFVFISIVSLTFLDFFLGTPSPLESLQHFWLRLQEWSELIDEQNLERLETKALVVQTLLGSVY